MKIIGTQHYPNVQRVDVYPIERESLPGKAFVDHRVIEITTAVGKIQITLSGVDCQLHNHIAENGGNDHAPIEN